jgi:putative transposase
MSYSLDLRERVVEYIEAGGSPSKAEKRYKVSRATIYRWLNRVDLRPTVVKRRQRKLDWKALEKDVQENPEAKLADRAKKFGVRPSTIHYALRQMKITRKKRVKVPRTRAARENQIL